MKPNKRKIKTQVLYYIFTFCLHALFIFVFIFVCLQQIQIVAGEAAEGTDKGFPSMGLPYVGITAVFYPHTVLHCGQAHFLKPDIMTMTGSSLLVVLSSFLTGDGDGVG